MKRGRRFESAKILPLLVCRICPIDFVGRGLRLRSLKHCRGCLEVCNLPARSQMTHYSELERPLLMLLMRLGGRLVRETELLIARTRSILESASLKVKIQPTYLRTRHLVLVRRDRVYMIAYKSQNMCLIPYACKGLKI